MIDLIIQNPNQNLLYRPNRETHIIKNNTDVIGFYEKAMPNQTGDTLYSFPLEEANTVSYSNHNPLSIYDEQAYKILTDVIETIKESCKKYDLSYKKNKYFLYSEIVEDQNPEFWYDAGGAFKPNLFGIISLDNASSSLFINENSLTLNQGDIVVSEAGNKIKYTRPFKSIVFYASPVSTIKNQYSQKWIPLV